MSSSLDAAKRSSAALASWRDWPLMRWLPLVLLAAMMAGGLIIETLLHGRLLWVSKLPLGALLALAGLRLRRGREKS